MAYTLEHLPGEPILLATLPPDFDLSADTASCAEVCLEILDEAAKPLVLILDITQASGKFSDFLPAVASRQAGRRAVLHHPKVRQAIVVSTRNVVRLACRALRERQNGHINIAVVDTVEEALELARRTNLDSH
jgi:hypothetical protein